MKDSAEIKPNYAPIYAAALYPDLAEIFISHGYALAVHGSLARDLDLVAIPWVKEISKPEDVLAEITKTFWIRLIGERGIKEHGRIAYTISVGHGECAIDLSFFNNPVKI
jgi:hypothetical protein